MRILKNLPTITLAATTLFAGAAHAAVVETTYTGWDIFGTEKHFEVRYGSGAVGGDWEVGRKDGAAVAETGQLAWTNGSPQSFSLVHSTATQELTLSIGGTQIAWDMADILGWNELSVLAKSSANAGGTYTSTITNLVLNGTALGNDTLSASDGAKSGVNLSGELFSDFTLTGQLALSWTGATPSNSRIEMFVGVAQAVPVPLPAAFWLLGSGLMMLLASARHNRAAG